jgi:DNA (cytosine-5)-methyltransferase 1
MKYLSVCSGIEAASAAWHPLGWKPWAFSEIEKFPSAVLAVHYPDVPNLGDMTKFKDWPDAAINVLVGGTPCQSYSVAGLRKGLDDPRGDLMLTYVAIARRYRPSWVVWENVPGVLSDDEGRSFGTLLGLLTGTIVEVPKDGWQSAGFVEGYKGAYGLAWRVLDSQFVRVDGFGRAVPQRRRRVFVVGYLGDWRRAAAVLFERESMSGNSAPRREAGKGSTGATEGGFASSGDGFWRDGIGPLRAREQDSHENLAVLAPDVANPLTARMHKGVNTTMDEGQTMIGEPVAFDCKAGGETGFAIGDVPGPMRGEGHGGGHSAVAFQPRFARNGRGAPDTVASALTGEAGRTGKGDSAQCVAFGIRSDASRTGEAVTPSADAEGRVRLRNPGMGVYEELAPTIDSSQPHSVAFTVSENSHGFAWESEVNPTLQARGQNAGANQFDGVLSGWAVRRLTPTECERLQAFPDGYTNIPWRGKNGAPDGPRYKALGNSMSVNVMRWIGMRVEKVDAIAK